MRVLTVLCIHHLNVVFLFPSVVSKLCGALWTVCAYLDRFLRPGMARSADPDGFSLKKPQIRQPGQIFKF
jgi:hypothetical protein